MAGTTTQSAVARVVADQRGRGRGLVAARDIKAGEVLFEVPLELAPGADILEVLRYSGPPAAEPLLALINDACPLTFTRALPACTTTTAVKECVRAYICAETRSACNVREVLHPANAPSPTSHRTVATRDIKAGEDILRSYGETYWVQWALNEAKSPRARLACLRWLIDEQKRFPRLALNGDPTRCDERIWGIAHWDVATGRKIEAAIDPKHPMNARVASGAVRVTEAMLAELCAVWLHILRFHATPRTPDVACIIEWACLWESVA